MADQTTYSDDYKAGVKRGVIDGIAIGVLGMLVVGFFIYLKKGK